MLTRCREQHRFNLWKLHQRGLIEDLEPIKPHLTGSISEIPREFHFWANLLLRYQFEDYSIIPNDVLDFIRKCFRNKTFFFSMKDYLFALTTDGRTPDYNFPKNWQYEHLFELIRDCFYNECLKEFVLSGKKGGRFNEVFYMPYNYQAEVTSYADFGEYVKDYRGHPLLFFDEDGREFTRLQRKPKPQPVITEVASQSNKDSENNRLLQRVRYEEKVSTNGRDNCNSITGAASSIVQNGFLAVSLIFKPILQWLASMLGVNSIAPDIEANSIINTSVALFHLFYFTQIPLFISPEWTMLQLSKITKLDSSLLMKHSLDVSMLFHFAANVGGSCLLLSVVSDVKKSAKNDKVENITKDSNREEAKGNERDNIKETQTIAKGEPKEFTVKTWRKLAGYIDVLNHLIDLHWFYGFIFFRFFMGNYFVDPNAQLIKFAIGMLFSLSCMKYQADSYTDLSYLVSNDDEADLWIKLRWKLKKSFLKIVKTVSKKRSSS